jgi:hypothetical protein
MTIDSTALATAVVSSFLLPYIKLGAEKLSEEIGKTLGNLSAEYASGMVKRLWERVKAVFSSDDEKAVLAQFEKRPDAARALVESILQEKLGQDNQLAQELMELINAPGPDGKSTGAQIMQAGIAGIVDARGANFTNASGVTISGVTFGRDSEQKTS